MISCKKFNALLFGWFKKIANKNKFQLKPKYEFMIKSAKNKEKLIFFH